jgi:hypothetical protein
MKLTQDEVPQKVIDMLKVRDLEARRLDRIRLYLRDPDPTRTNFAVRNGPLGWLPPKAPREVRRLAEIARVNMLKFVVGSVVQVMYVDGFRVPKSGDNQPSWTTWQLNRMDARQTGVHRSGLSYGVSYVTVLPGDPVPVIRGVPPRKMTAVYGDDDDWPAFALELRRSPEQGRQMYRLFDDTYVWWVMTGSPGPGSDIAVLRSEKHGLGKVPVVRFRCTIDEDNECPDGEVEPLMPLQDQINITTFGLLVAQHYGAFRQRYIMGWLADSEDQMLEASARKIWTFDDPDTKVGEFGQTDLAGYISSREASLRHLATVSQTPAHELLGQLVNLSAEALAAAEASHRRKLSERQIVMGEAWEQVLELAGDIQQQETDPEAYVRWRDTEARSLAQVADALGKLSQMLGIPPQELWERIPGVTQQEIEQWKAAAEKGDAFANLTAMLDRQAAPPAPAPAPAPAPTAG